VRYRVLALAFLAAWITYLDRVCISAAAPSISRDLSLSDLQMGYVFSVFALAYGLFEVPMGLFGDRYGQRGLLTRIVASWSIFTALTGMVRSFGLLIAIRFLFGAAEAGAFPTLARGLARWFPQPDRGWANGVMWMGARLGGALAPLLAAALIARIGWRPTFVVFGAVGVIWCVVFWRAYRDDPAAHPSVSSGELQYIRGGREFPAGGTPRASWTIIFRSPDMWALFGMYFSTSYGFWFLITWLPTYLMREHGQTLQQSGFYAVLPLGVGAAACLIGGALSDWLVRRSGSLRWGRRAVGMTGFFLAAAGFAAAAGSTGPLTAMLALAFAQGALDLAVPVAWATCADIGGRFGGTATGFMNTASSLSAMVSPVSGAWLSSRFGSFHAMFVVAAAVYVFGGLLWLLIDPSHNLEGKA
jgi:ACS family glucarate transporter-like MFS transporter